MQTLSVLSYVTLPSDLEMSRITDLLLHDGTLYGTTRFDGQISAWETATLATIDTIPHVSGPSLGAQPGLSIVNDMLISGGWNAGNMARHTLAGDGGFASTGNLGSNSRFAGPLVQPISVTLNDTPYLYGGIIGGAGLAQIGFATNNSIASTQITTGPQIAALTSSTVAHAPYLFSASATDLGVTAWALDASGTPVAQSTLKAEDGFWANAPTAMGTVIVAGETYVITAAAGSSSLTVMHVSAGGGMVVTDHIIDDRFTRFEGASALEIVEHGGQSYVITGGSDDGISVYLVLPGGQLLARGHIADTDTSGLANISAIAAQTNGSGIDLFAASSTEPGVTKLRLETGIMGTTQTADATGQTLTGTNGLDLLIGAAGADHLRGQSGDDILFDGAGQDTLTGGTGADTFILAYDGQTDTITDFTLGEDILDLSAWPSLRDASQLFFASTTNGIRITYGTDAVEIINAAGTPLLDTDFTTQMLIGATRLPQQAVTGFAGPITTPPNLPDRIPYVPPTQDPAPPEDGIERLGTAQAETLTGTDEDDVLWGQANNDTLFGNAGNDMLFGGPGRDAIFGGDGGDILSGGGGRDMDWSEMAYGTSDNNDQLYGGNGNDRLYGYAGDDVLQGNAGNDVLIGGGGRDTFIFASGQDRITDFNANLDRIQLDSQLWEGSKTAAQIIANFGATRGGRAYLEFDTHSLQIDGLTDLTQLTGALDLL